MRKGPTVEEVQHAIDKSWADEDGSDDSHYVPPYASGFIVADNSQRHIRPIVEQTFVLGDEEDDVQAYATVHLNGSMRVYNVTGWRVTLLTEDAALAKRLNGGGVGDKSMVDGEIIVSIDGSPVVAYQEALLQKQERQQLQEQARQLQKQARQQQVVDKQRLTTRIEERADRLRQDRRNLTEFQQLEQFYQALNYEMNVQQKLLTQLNLDNWKTGHTEEIERDLLKAEEREETLLAPMRKQANLLDQERRRRDVEQQRQNQLHREQELQVAQRLRQEQVNKRKEEAKQKQEAIDKQAAQFDRSTGPLAYEEATTQIGLIKHHMKEGASHHIIREWAAHMHSRCMKSRDAVPYTSAPASGGAGTNLGAIVGGMFGVIGGPLGMVFGAAAGGLIGNIADSISQPSPERNQRNQWTILIVDIDELISKLPV